MFVFYSVRLTNQTSNYNIIWWHWKKAFYNSGQLFSSYVEQCPGTFPALTWHSSEAQVYCDNHGSWRWATEQQKPVLTTLGNNESLGRLCGAHKMNRKLENWLQEWVSPEDQGKRSRKHSSQLWLELPVRMPPSLQPPCLPLKSLWSGPRPYRFLNTRCSQIGCPIGQKWPSITPWQN